MKLPWKLPFLISYIRELIELHGAYLYYNYELLPL